MSETKSEKIIVGNKEKVSFPELKRAHVVARIDSGALSSSAHCDKIWLEKMGGKKVLCCYFLKRSHKVVRFEKFRKKKVKSSNGTFQNRYVVDLVIKMGGIAKCTPVTLTDRSTMNYSVLLGRKFLKDHFLIDVSRSYMLSKKTK